LRHDLTLFTKGHPEEQKLKIGRSGLGALFGHTAIVKEKDATAYRRLVEERGLDAERTWMIGNSPKSDQPALAAGLNAVFVPHAHTWILEKQELRPGKANCWWWSSSRICGDTSEPLGGPSSAAYCSDAEPSRRPS